MFARSTKKMASAAAAVAAAVALYHLIGRHAGWRSTRPI
jgi:hypothetical protein